MHIPMHIPQGSLHMICECFFLGKIDRKLYFSGVMWCCLHMFKALEPSTQEFGGLTTQATFILGSASRFVSGFSCIACYTDVHLGCCSPTAMHLPTASDFFLNQSHYQLLVAHLDFARARCARSTAHMVSSEKKVPRNLPVYPNSSLLKP